MLVIVPAWDAFNERAFLLSCQHKVLTHNCADTDFSYAWPTTTTRLELLTACEVGQELGGN